MKRGLHSRPIARLNGFPSFGPPAAILGVCPDADIWSDSPDAVGGGVGGEYLAVGVDDEDADRKMIENELQEALAALLARFGRLQFRDVQQHAVPDRAAVVAPTNIGAGAKPVRAPAMLKRSLEVERRQ